MKIGVPKEIKNNEYRVGLTPAAVAELVAHSHEVYLETSAGVGSGFGDAEYRHSGATVVAQAEEVFAQAELIIKVKEPQKEECKYFCDKHILFTYLHLAPDHEQTQMLLDSGATCIAYETITSDSGGLPLLTPMSEVAGKLSIQAGSMCLQKIYGGIGLLPGGVAGTGKATVTIIGGGVVGTSAATVALGMGANVIILDTNLDRLRMLEHIFLGCSAQFLYSHGETLRQSVEKSDLVVAGVLIPGAVAPKLVTRKMISSMREGSVYVDVSIDQGGCSETSCPTSHSEPTYIEEGVVHYCVTNMPSLVSRTSTDALNNATLPFVCALADKGIQVLKEDSHFANGLNIYQGKVTNEAVATSQQRQYVPFAQLQL